ncbi:hypothetical protein CPB84DRAFT_1764875 [Gymnopilus junonius]|uniref:Uncharacterized protein n=1 Tax=Gymnopilus junonius TaxID=109634 RepID=A0A9P5P0L7_GYMJU|nr:hypothetical protein CPB84DRAFT_1764875 [Gymnopilus junonius]
MTDEEDHEAITPPSTWGKDDRRWTSGTDGSYTMTNATHTSFSALSASGGLPKGVDDDDMFKAALALCGLGRRT